MRPLYPGQLHTIRLNMWNVILVLDLSQAISLETISSTVATMIQRGVPIHFGVVPMFDPKVNDLGKLRRSTARIIADNLANKMARIYQYSLSNLGRGATREMFQEVRSYQI